MQSTRSVFCSAQSVCKLFVSAKKNVIVKLGVNKGIKQWAELFVQILMGTLFTLLHAFHVLSSPFNFNLFQVNETMCDEFR